MAIVNRRIKVMHIISGDLWAGAEVQAYTLLKELQPLLDLHVILMNNGELAERLIARKIPVSVLDESRMSAAKILLQMRRIMLMFKPDIVHTHRQKENILGALANLFSTRSPSVRTSHGAPEFAAKGLRRVQVALDRWIGSYLQQGIISVSGDLAEKLKKKFPPEKIWTIPNGIDVEKIKEEAGTSQKANQELHIGIIGRLEPVKRVDIFLNMAALLMERCHEKQLMFHIIGDGSLRQPLEVQSNRMGLNDRVIFYGHRKDIPSRINGLDVVVMCSDHEGTPMTALETLALGVPLVGHNVGGLREILEPYPHLLVDDHTPQGYAAAVARVLEKRTGKVELAPKYLAAHNAVLTTELYASLLHRSL